MGTFARRALIIGLGALLITPGTVMPRAWAACQWSVVQGAAVKRGNLTSILAFSGTDVWGVGGRVNEGLMEHWDGTTWTRILGLSSLDHAPLTDLRAVSPADLWMLGRSLSTGSGDVIRRQGSTWLVGPNPTSGAPTIAVISSSDVWAVGHSFSTPHSFAEHWDGTAWTRVPTPADSLPYSGLTAVTAFSSSNVWAVGTAAGELVLEHWNGQRWKMVPGPTPAPAFPGLNAIAGSSGHDIWAVGVYNPGTEQDALILHYDGTSWTQVADPGITGFLEDVSVRSPNSAWAVGSTGVGSLPRAMHWDGATWEPTPIPDTGEGLFESVAAVPGSHTAWTVGTQTQVSTSPLIERWC